MAETKTNKTAVKAKTPIQEWGPYADYLIINTPHGDFGLPAGHIMRLEEQISYNPKTHSNVKAMLPVYERVHIDDPRTRPGHHVTGEK